MTKPKRSWRDVVRIHPAADLFPLMPPDELRELGEDIKANGLRVQPAWYWPPEAGAGGWMLLDGRNRLDAMELVGLPVLTDMDRIRDELADTPLWKGDPYEFVLSVNVRRRHLTPAQKREIVAKVVKAQPEKSNRTIAKQAKVHHETVGAVRQELERRGEIRHVSTVEDTKGRKQPTHKPRRTADDFVAERKAKDLAIAAAAEERSKQQATIAALTQHAAAAVDMIMDRDRASPGFALAVQRGIAKRLAANGTDDDLALPDFLKREPAPML